MALTKRDGGDISVGRAPLFWGFHVSFGGDGRTLGFPKGLGQIGL